MHLRPLLASSRWRRSRSPINRPDGLRSGPLSELTWRNIGPFRGGRTKAAAGIPAQPNVFYIGAVNGGVWKTTDAGRTWTPIFDDQPTGSIGAIAVAPSDPNIIYVGSGEGLQRPDLSTGDGIYKSTDAGRTWTHLGLRDGQQIPADHRRSARSAIGCSSPCSAIRTVRTRSAASSDRPTARRRSSACSIKDENTGGVDLAFDPAERQHASTRCSGSRARRRGRTASSPARAADSSNRPTAAHVAADRQRPADVRGRRARPHRHRRRAEPRRSAVFATVEARARGGLYRSDDAGETFSRS